MIKIPISSSNIACQWVDWDSHSYCYFTSPKLELICHFNWMTTHFYHKLNLLSDQLGHHYNLQFLILVTTFHLNLTLGDI